MARRVALPVGLLLGAVAVALLLTGVTRSATTGTRAEDGATGQPTRTVRVAAAADLTAALDEVAADVRRAHPEIELAITYGSSGTFVQQIAQGAPVDLYLSADIGYVERLVDLGRVDPGEVFGYATGRLALVLPPASPLGTERGLAVLADPSIATVAIANPEHAPYGVAAVAALRSAGVYDAVAGKLVLGENAAQAAEFVRSGNADAGVVPLSLVRAARVAAGAGTTWGAWYEVPPQTFPPLRQSGAVLRAARDPEAARVVRDHLLGPAGQAVLSRHGFRPAG